ncbi:MAG: arginase family protein, partial [Flammeovirgaceae bacterium]|nr:arginase family protein [Flammeovirgaceae bacterium]
IAGFSTGWSTPVPNRITVEEAKVLNAELCKDARVCAQEIVEINPTLDTENRTAEGAFEKKKPFPPNQLSNRPVMVS